jgi:hypothetical protein
MVSSHSPPCLLPRLASEQVADGLDPTERGRETRKTFGEVDLPSDFRTVE